MCGWRILVYKRKLVLKSVIINELIIRDSEEVRQRERTSPLGFGYTLRILTVKSIYL